MNNKTLTKKSKWLKLALISTATVSTLATIPAAICAKSVTDKSPTNNLAIPTYKKLVFKLRQADKDAGATISGQTITSVLTGEYFGTVNKPIVSMFGYTFKGWSTKPTKESSDEPLPDTYKINTNTTVYAILENSTSIVVKGKTEVALGSKTNYTATVSTGQGVKWYVNDGKTIPEDPDGGHLPSSDYAKISNEDGHKGELTTKKLSDGAKTTYVFAILVGQPVPATIDPNASNVLQIKIVDPAEGSDQIITYQTVDGENVYYSINPSELYSTDGDVTLTPLAGGVSITESKIKFDYPLIFGDKITTIDNNFLPIEEIEGQWKGFIKFNNTITFNNVIFIGNGFLNDNTLFNKPLNFPSTLRYIGDGFLSDSTAFNSPVTFGDNPNLSYIGRDFMNGCEGFGAASGLSIELPKSLNHVGEFFMYNCKNQKAITIGCDAEVFDACDTSLAVFNGTHNILVTCKDKAVFSELQTQLPNSEEGAATNIRTLKAIEFGDNQACIVDDDFNFHYCDSLNNCNITSTNASAKILADKQSDGTYAKQYERGTFNFPIYINPNKIPDQAIGDYFLNGCGVFNQPIDLSGIKKIGQGFLFSCSNFNQPLTIPNSITENGAIGDSFIQDCNQMISTIRIQCPISAFTTSSDSASFAVTWNKWVPCFTTGIKIAGLTDEQWQAFHVADNAMFPHKDIVIESRGIWRNLIRA